MLLAVLVGDSLFFIFGCNDSEYQQVNNYLHVLNVSSYTWIESVPGAEAQQKIISPPNDDDKSLTVGAIAGIVIGCVAAVSFSNIINIPAKKYKQDALVTSGDP